MPRVAHWRLLLFLRILCLNNRRYLQETLSRAQGQPDISTSSHRSDSVAPLRRLCPAQAQISDTDYATETSNLTKLQIMQQAGTASLAQAKNLNQAVVSLLS